MHTQRRCLLRTAARCTLAGRPPGGFPESASAIVQAWPELAKVLPDMHSHAGSPPSSVAVAEVVDSLDRLLQQVQADAAFW